eukprot:RCo006737
MQIMSHIRSSEGRSAAGVVTLASPRWLRKGPYIGGRLTCAVNATWMIMTNWEGSCEPPGKGQSPPRSILAEHPSTRAGMTRNAHPNLLGLSPLDRGAEVGAGCAPVAAGMRRRSPRGSLVARGSLQAEKKGTGEMEPVAVSAETSAGATRPTLITPGCQKIPPRLPKGQPLPTPAERAPLQHPPLQPPHSDTTARRSGCRSCEAVRRMDHFQGVVVVGLPSFDLSLTASNERTVAEAPCSAERVENCFPRNAPHPETRGGLSPDSEKRVKHRHFFSFGHGVGAIGCEVIIDC